MFLHLWFNFMDYKLLTCWTYCRFLFCYGISVFLVILLIFPLSIFFLSWCLFLSACFHRFPFIVTRDRVFFLRAPEDARIYWRFLVSSFLKFLLLTFSFFFFSHLLILQGEEMLLDSADCWNMKTAFELITETFGC